MPRGRPPAPTDSKRLYGNPGHRPLNPNEPVTTVGLPKAPDFLDGEARRLYYRLGRQLVREHRMALVYQGVFIVLCQAYGMVAKASERITVEGAVVMTPSGFQRPSPWVGILNQSQTMLMKAAAEFGITPASQSRVSKVALPRAKSKLEVFKGGKSEGSS